MRPCLIAIDIDGTLLNSQGQVSARNRAALAEAHQAGVEVVIATGRRHTYAMRVVRDLNIHATNALVSSNGTVIRTIGQAELIHRTHFSGDTGRWLCQHMADFRDTLVFTFDNVDASGEDLRGALVCESSNILHDSVGNWMKANEPYIRHVDHIEQAFAPAAPQRSRTAVALAEPEPDPADDNGPIQAMVCGPIARMEAAEARLLQHPAVAGVGEPEFPGCEIALQRTVYPDRDLAILDILPAGCSKASALAYLAELRGCTLADIMAIGDNFNDLPMLHAAGQAVLMGNAPAELHELARQQGWHIGPGNDEDGVAQAIEAALR